MSFICLTYKSSDHQLTNFSVMECCTSHQILKHCQFRYIRIYFFKELSERFLLPVLNKNTQKIDPKYNIDYWSRVFITTFYNISVISVLTVLMVKEITRVPTKTTDQLYHSGLYQIQLATRANRTRNFGDEDYILHLNIRVR